MRALMWYGAATALLLGVLAAAVVLAVEGADPVGVWLAAALAWPVQLAAFGAVVAFRGGPRFMIGWGGGIALRFAAVGAMAAASLRTDAFDAATGLVSLVGFLFVLVLLEPWFLRLAD